MKLRVIIGILLLLGVVSHAKEKKEIVLSGIASSKKGTFAMMNGKPYYVGEIIYGSKIVAISKGKVALVRSGRTNLLYLSRADQPVAKSEDDSLMGSVKGFFISDTTDQKSVSQQKGGSSLGDRRAQVMRVFFEQWDENEIFVVSVSIGYILSFIASIWFLVVAFKENIFWGLGCLFLGIVSLIFLFVHWHEAKKPFLLSFLGVIVIIVSFFLFGGEFLKEFQKV